MKFLVQWILPLLRMMLKTDTDLGKVQKVILSRLWIESIAMSF